MTMIHEPVTDSAVWAATEGGVVHVDRPGIRAQRSVESTHDQVLGDHRHCAAEADNRQHQDDRQ